MHSLFLSPSGIGHGAAWHQYKFGNGIPGCTARALPRGIFCSSSGPLRFESVLNAYTVKTCKREENSNANVHDMLWTEKYMLEYTFLLATLLLIRKVCRAPAWVVPFLIIIASYPDW